MELVLFGLELNKVVVNFESSNLFILNLNHVNVSRECEILMNKFKLCLVCSVRVFAC